MINFKFLLAASLLVAGAATARAQACVGKSVEVKNTGMKTAKPVNTSTSFDQDGVQQHFDSLTPITDFRPNTKSTFSCVDSRGEVNELGTPGGDFAELAAAIQVYMDQTKTPVTDDAVFKIFKAFVEANTDADRPFYFHTSDEKLHKVFHAVAEEGVRKPTVFPEIMPADAKAKEAWLKALSTGKYQGCGHVRLMIDQYADYNMPSADVPKALVRAFFNYWWGTPIGSAQRQRVKFQIVQGPLDGHAVAIIGNSAGGCDGYSPALPPSHGGSQVFMYHATAVDDFRKSVLTPFFVDYAKKNGKTLDGTKYYNALKSLQAKQLTAVLTLLAPANELPIWAVTIGAAKGTGSETPGVTPPANTRPDLANPAGGGGAAAAAKPSSAASP